MVVPSFGGIIVIDPDAATLYAKPPVLVSPEISCTSELVAVQVSVTLLPFGILPLEGTRVPVGRLRILVALFQKIIFEE